MLRSSLNRKSPSLDYKRLEARTYRPCRDGKLILSEITNPLLRFHMIVGSFEGWWAGNYFFGLCLDIADCLSR